MTRNVKTIERILANLPAWASTRDLVLVSGLSPDYFKKRRANHLAPNAALKKSGYRYPKGEVRRWLESLPTGDNGEIRFPRRNRPKHATA
jgi:hypothetical protein